ncbi:hypothetical protein [Acinetobacter baumannii]|uniref:hypothetical protein n=1 Tax=Acinetobacter baumannii TaxID=470 RepID=UPI003004F549
MPTRYNTGEYSYDLEYHYGDMSASMEMLRARLIELLTPHLSDRYRYFLVGEKKKVKCKACKGFGFIRDDGWGHIDKCEMCDAEKGASHE